MRNTNTPRARLIGRVRSQIFGNESDECASTSEQHAVISERSQIREYKNRFALAGGRNGDYIKRLNAYRLHLELRYEACKAIEFSHEPL